MSRGDIGKSARSFPGGQVEGADYLIHHGSPADRISLGRKKREQKKRKQKPEAYIPRRS
jgi:hypothetical protein